MSKLTDAIDRLNKSVERLSEIGRPDLTAMRERAERAEHEVADLKVTVASVLDDYHKLYAYTQLCAGQRPAPMEGERTIAVRKFTDEEEMQLRALGRWSETDERDQYPERYHNPWPAAPTAQEWADAALKYHDVQYFEQEVENIPDHWKDAIAHLASAITMCDASVALRHVTHIVNAARAKDAEMAQLQAERDADASLDDEEDRFVRKLWVDTTPPPWYEQGKVLTEINALIAKDVPPEDEEP